MRQAFFYAQKMMETLKIAIQKSGRLQEKSLNLLQECGFHFLNGKNQLKTQATNFPLELLFLRDDDIPEYVQDGVADLGIVGENILEEKSYKTKLVKKLGFARCRLSIAVPRESDLISPQQLNGKRIATSYPTILQNYLNSMNISAEIHSISGSVEIAPGIGLADAIFDIVSTGSTLLSNGLKETIQVMKSEAVLIKTPQLNDAKEAILDQLLFRLSSVQNANNNKYILLNAPNEKIDEIAQILPGMNSPTVLPLLQKGWSSIHSVVTENDFWEKINALKEAGARGILIVPIEKMIL